MGNEDKQVTTQELVAFGVGLTVTIASALLTSLVNPIAFPFNILISLGLGGTAGYGALKVLDPRTRQDIFDAQTDSQYRQMLREIEDIVVRTGTASQSLRVIDTEMSRRLGSIGRMIEMILDRIRERRRDFAEASATLLILQKFEGVLAHYLKVKRGELFMDVGQRKKVISEVETQVIPMFELALENLGKKIDAGETLDKDISRGTLESMLRSLHLIESLKDQIDSSSKKGVSR